MTVKRKASVRPTLVSIAVPHAEPLRHLERQSERYLTPFPVADPLPGRAGTTDQADVCAFAIHANGDVESALAEVTVMRSSAVLLSRSPGSSATRRSASVDPVSTAGPPFVQTPDPRRRPAPADPCPRAAHPGGGSGRGRNATASSTADHNCVVATTAMSRVRCSV